MPHEYIVSGTILYGDDFEPREGYVVISGHKIKEIGFGRHDSEVSGLICPAFINAHTHLGDSVAKDLPFMPLADLVAPPGGLKHRILNAASPGEIADGIRSSLACMAAGGTCHCLDFRENGIAGARLLKEVAGARATVLGRPAGCDSPAEVLEVADGLGVSGANDVPGDALAEMAASARRAGKLLGIHAGELDRSDIGKALEISPDFLVHMTHADAANIKKVADAGIPVVVCPRSNAATGAGIPPVRKLADSGTLLALGTDNVMLNGPDMFREMEWAAKAFLHDDAYTLSMATLNGAKLAGCDKTKGSIFPGKDADLLVLDQNSENLKYSRNMVSSIVRRAGPADIEQTIIGGKIWQNFSKKS